MRSAFGCFSEILHQLQTKKSSVKIARYPLFESLPVFRALAEAMTVYQDAIETVIRSVRDWSFRDPVSMLYQEVFGSEVVVDPAFDREETLKNLVWRKRHKVPPGYKDSGKDDKGIGDLLIWKTILHVGQERSLPAVLVTGDEKADWWHRSDGLPLYPRYELLEEYRRQSGGASFYLLSLADLLGHFGARADVVDEVRREEAPQEPNDYQLALSAGMVTGGNAMMFDDGQLLVVRHDGKYGAVKALRQTVDDEGGRIEYQWWYQRNGSGSFVGPDVLTGGGTTSESVPVPGSPPCLQIGPLCVAWSIAANGLGYLYFGDYELGRTSMRDVSGLDATRVKLFRDMSAG